MSFFWLLCCLLKSALPVGTVSDADAKIDARIIVGRLEAVYRPAKTLQATFLERYSEGGRTVRVESGVAYFRRPGKMRFDYESPEKNLFLVDGKFAWFYVPADHTVTKVPAKDSSDWRTPLALLAGEMKVSRVCKKVEAAVDEHAENPDNVLLYCTLRGVAAESDKNANTGATIQTTNRGDAIFFEVVRATGELSRILVRESGGIEVEFRFTHWQFNPAVAESLFHFNPPLGVAIVNGELPAQPTDVK
jgi:outer membrane lipoprotein carrier protein